MFGAGLGMGVTEGLVIGEDEASEILEPVVSPIFTAEEALFFFLALSLSKVRAIADLLLEVEGGLDIFTNYSFWKFCNQI